MHLVNSAKTKRESSSRLYRFDNKKLISLVSIQQQCKEQEKDKRSTYRNIYYWRKCLQTCRNCSSFLITRSFLKINSQQPERNTDSTCFSLPLKNVHNPESWKSLPEHLASWKTASPLMKSKTKSTIASPLSRAVQLLQMHLIQPKEKKRIRCRDPSPRFSQQQSPGTKKYKDKKQLLV